jgi:ribosome-binding factor A
MSANRKAKVAEAIRDTLSEMIAREVKDPRVSAAGVVSITQVEMNADLSVANVYVSVFGDERVADGAVAGLKGAAGFLRGPLARKLRLARPPELRFHRDTGLAFGMELTKIVREDEAKARAAGRDSIGGADDEAAGRGGEGDSE